MASRVSAGTEMPCFWKQPHPASFSIISRPGIAVCRTRTAAGITSRPMPSPGMTTNVGMCFGFSWRRLFSGETAVRFNVRDDAAGRDDFLGEFWHRRKGVSFTVRYQDLVDQVEFYLGAILNALHHLGGYVKRDAQVDAVPVKDARVAQRDDGAHLAALERCHGVFA